MKSLSSDALVLGASAIIITTFSFLLFLDFTSKIEAGDAEQIGVITFKKRVSQRKYGTQVIWEEIEQNAPVYVNDSIRTAERSEAVVKLKDGTSLELDENSMIVLAKSEGAININFAQGAMFARRAEVAAEGSPAVNIVSGAATVSIEKSDVKLSQSDKEDLNLTVAKGSAVIKTGEEEKVLAVNQNAVVLKDAKVAQVREVKLHLVSPDPNTYIVTGEDAHAVVFSWEPTGDDGGVLFELAKDRGFATVVKRMRVKGESVSEKVPAGEYYWRIASEDKAAGKTDYSDSRKISIVSDRPVLLFSPDDAAKFSFVSAPPLIRFRWSKNELASGYVLEIARDANFKDVIMSGPTVLTEQALDTLREGTYFWRVSSKIAMAGDYSGKSAARKFIVEKKRQVAATEPIGPPDGALMSPIQVRNKGMLLSWKLVEGVASYEILLSKSKDFSKSEVQQVVSGNYIRIVKDFQAGEYFWKVKPVVGADAEGPGYSAVRKLTVLESGGINLISPVNNFSVKPQKDAANIELSFSWSKVPINGNFVFELSKEPSFKQIEWSDLISATSIKTAVAPGTYYWRVSLVDDDRSELFKSDVRSFRVMEPERTPPKATLVVIPAPEAAMVFVNGAKIGQGKVSVPLEGGNAKIEVLAEGYKKFESTIDIRAGEKKEFIATLEKLPQKPTLSVRVNPARSAVYVNGVLAGYGNVRVNPDAGLVRLVVQSAGYKKYEKELILKEGESREIVAELELVRREAEMVVPQLKTADSLASPPLVYGSAVVTTTSTGTVIATQKSGAFAWKTELKSKVESTPVASGEAIYVVTSRGELVALDAGNGKVRWKKNIDGPVLFASKPLIAEDKVIVATSYGSVEAYSKDGRELWKLKVGGVFSSPSQAQGVLYVGAGDRNIYALSIKNGNIVWKFATDSRMVASSPIVHRNLVYAGCYSGTLYAIAAKDGTLRWKYEAKSPIVTNPVVWQQKIAIAPMNGEITALAADTGKVLWIFQSKSKIVLDPLYKNGEIYAAGDRSFYILDAESGKEKWKMEFESTIKTAPSLVGEDVVMALKNGEMVSLNPAQRKRNR